MEKINDEDFYTPQEAVKALFKGEKSSTQVLLRHIRQGKLKAKNVGGEKKARYVLQGKHLITYRDRMVRPAKYNKK